MTVNYFTRGTLWDSVPERTDRVGPFIFVLVWAYYWIKQRNHNKVKSKCNTKVIGIVKFIKDAHLEVNRRRYLNITIEYLNRESILQNIEPDFKYIFSIGDPIPLKYNPNSPEEVVLDYQAIEEGNWEKDTSKTTNNTHTQNSADISSIIQTALAGGSVQSGKHGNVNIVVQDSEPTIIKASDINASDNPELASIIEQLKQTATTQKPTSATKPQENSTSMIKITDIRPQFSRGANIYEISGEVFNSDLNGKSLTFNQTLTTEQAGEVIPGRMLPCDVSGKSYNLEIALNI